MLFKLAYGLGLILTLACALFVNLSLTHIGVPDTVLIFCKITSELVVKLPTLNVWVPDPVPVILPYNVPVK